MLYHIKQSQSHSPDMCYADSGGSVTLYDPDAKGVKLLAMFGALYDHVIFYLVEADDLKAVNQFLLPGFKRCTSSVTLVSQELVMA